MRVLALMKYGGLAASTRQRLLQFLPYLERHGVQVDVEALLDDEHLRRLARGQRPRYAMIAAAYFKRVGQLLFRSNFDALWVHYELFPYLPGPFERLASRSGKPIIVDTDDAIFHMYDRRRVRWLLGDKLAPLLRAASACLCGNAYLSRYAQRYCRNCVIVPTVVDTERYLPREASTRPGPAVVGWIGTPTTLPYVRAVLPALLPEVARGRVRIRIVGGGPGAGDIPGIEAIDWSEESEIADIQAMDIGIMPLPDAPWAQGKCGYKLIQYMACGLPVIATPVGVNSDIVADGESGFLVRSDAEWQAALARLLGDPGLRAAMGQRGRAIVEGRYSLSSQEPRVLAALRSAVAARRSPGV